MSQDEVNFPNGGLPSWCQTVMKTADIHSAHKQEVEAVMDSIQPQFRATPNSKVSRTTPRPTCGRGGGIRIRGLGRGQCERVGGHISPRYRLGHRPLRPVRRRKNGDIGSTCRGLKIQKTQKKYDPQECGNRILLIEPQNKQRSQKGCGRRIWQADV